MSLSLIEVMVEYYADASATHDQTKPDATHAPPPSDSPWPFVYTLPYRASTLTLTSPSTCNNNGLATLPASTLSTSPLPALNLTLPNTPTNTPQNST